MNSAKLTPFVVAGMLVYATPAQTHMTAECLTSILKMNLASTAVGRLYSTWLTGKLAGWTPKQLATLYGQLHTAKVKRDAAQQNLVLCCAPGRASPTPGCDGTLDPNYDRYDLE